jgi:hypothetical protein
LSTQPATTENFSDHVYAPSRYPHRYRSAKPIIRKIHIDEVTPTPDSTSHSAQKAYEGTAAEAGLSGARQLNPGVWKRYYAAA